MPAGVCGLASASRRSTGASARLIAKTACFAIAGAIMFGSLWPRLGVPGPAGRDLVAHAAAYPVLRSLPCSGWRRVPVVGIAACAAALGIGLEVAQEFVPGRALSLADAFANIAAVALGAATARFWRSVP